MSARVEKMARQQTLGADHSGWMGFGVRREERVDVCASPGFGSPRRRSLDPPPEGVHWVPLTEQSLAAADWQNELENSRRALGHLDMNAPQSAVPMKDGRTPAFMRRLAAAAHNIERTPSTESLFPAALPASLERLPQSASLAQMFKHGDAKTQKALKACLPKLERRPAAEQARDPILCERMLPELAADDVMWCVTRRSPLARAARPCAHSRLLSRPHRYLLQLSHGSDRWVIMRRYSEWHALRTSLCSYGIGTHLPFPDKRLLWALCNPGGKHDPSVISQRTAELHSWASALLAIEAAAEHELVIDFFELVPGEP